MVMMTGEPAGGAIRLTAAETGEQGASRVTTETPSPGTGAVARERVAKRPCWLGPVKEFVVGSNWAAFVRQFEAMYQALDWSEAEALKTLPTALNDKALAILKAIPTEWRTTPQTACREIVEAFNPPLNAKKTFQ
ncbi:unnamed protein product [Lampetra planeri]